MDRADVLRVYDDAEFASGYNERFVLAPWPMHGIDFELGILRRLLGDGGNWIDLGCGTGWVLSQFPDVDRAGLDLSPAMLEEAKAANPGVPFRNADFTQDIEEFHGAWSVVSCMWMAYCYLESMPEVEALVANMARWTKPGGSAFLPSVIDLEDLRPHVQVPYEDWPDVWGGRIAVTGYNWTWEEPNGNVNANMMAVHVGHFVRLLEPFFEKVEVVRYPLFAPGMVSRKAVVATGRRPMGETGEAEVIWHPVPAHPEELAAAAEAQAEAERVAREAALQSEEAAARARAEADAAARAEAEAREEQVEIARQLAVLRHENEWLHETYDHVRLPLPDGSADLSATSTKRLLAEAVRRVNPLRRRFASSLRKRLPGAR